jgi:hypothetical protein
LCLPPFDRDDRQLLAHTMASDLSIAWQFSSKKGSKRIDFLTFILFCNKIFERIAAHVDAVHSVFAVEIGRAGRIFAAAVAAS